MLAWAPGVAKVSVMLVEVNLSVSTSLIVPTEARHLKRRPRKRVNAEAYASHPYSGLIYQVVMMLPQSFDEVQPR